MSDQTVGIIIGGVLVTLSGIAVAFVRAWQESQLDKQKRSDDRQIGRDAFQRENLLRLQEALAEWIRAEAQVHHRDQETLNEVAQLLPVPEEFGDRPLLGHAFPDVPH